MGAREVIRRADPRWVDVGLVALALVCAGVYVVKGVGFVLDDWFWLRNARFEGAVHAAGDTGGDRPVGALVYILFFGVIGPHPAAIVLLLGLANGCCAVLLRRLLAHWVPVAAAALVAGIWVVLPLRTSLEAWMSTGTAVLAHLLVLGALVVLVNGTRHPARLATVAGLTSLGILSYESVAVVAIPALVGIEIWIDRRVEVRRLLILVTPPLAALGWAYTHRLEGRSAIGGIRNPAPVLDANFGQGIAPVPALAAVGLVSALVGTVLVVRSAVRTGGSGGWPTPLWLVGVGWAVMLVGVLPYLTYFYSPFGAGDRLNALSAFGASMVWAGLLLSITDRRWMVLATCVLVGVGLAARVERSDLWSRAGRDGQAVSSAVKERFPSPDRPIVLGPEPIKVFNIAAFYDRSNVEAALQWRYDDPTITGGMADDADTFAALDAARYLLFDQRAVSTLDERSEP